MQNNNQRQINDKTSKIALTKQISLLIFGLFGLTLISLVIQLVTNFIARSVSPTDLDYELFTKSSLYMLIINGGAYTLLGSFFIYLLRNDSEELFKSFKEWKPYVAGLIGFAAIIIFNVTYNIILTSLGVKMADNANETTVSSLTGDFPFASLIIIGIIGPVCEELTYRVGLFSLTKRANRYLAYFVTILVFALIHFDFTSTTMTNELLNLPLYIFAGLTFTFLYDHYGLAASLSSHVTNNTFSILLTVISRIK